MKFRALLCIFYLFMLVDIAFCQRNIRIDSLQQLLSSAKEDTNKVNHLNQLCNEYHKIGNYKSTFSYADSALKLANRLNYPYGMANSFNNIGIFYRHESNYDKAMENYFSALKIREKIYDKQGTFDSYTNLGVVYNLQYSSEKNNSDKSLQYFFLALEIAQEINDKQRMAISYNNIGNVYSNKGELHSNSDSLTRHKNYEKALENYFASLKLNIERNHKRGIAGSYFNIGRINLIQKSYNEARHYSILALKIYEKINNKEGIAFTYINISNIYNEKSNYTEAMVWLQKALRIAKEIKAKEILVSSYEGLTEVSEKMGDYKNAYNYYRLYSITKDSIFNDESSKRIAEMQTKYEVESKDKEIVIKNKEIEIKELLIYKKNYLIVGLITLAIIIVVIALLLFWKYKMHTHRKTLELQQKLLRSQMNPHFLYNSLFSIQSYMFENNPDEAAVYLSKFADLMRLILENSREEYVPIQKEIKTLENYLELQKLCYQNPFSYTIQIDPRIDTDFISIPPMLAQPFIENAIIHGTAGKAAGQITIRFKLDTSAIVFEVEDNGIGIQQAEILKKNEQKKHKSLATDITRERLQNLNRGKSGKIKFEIIDLAASTNGRQTGTKIVFVIPFLR